MIKLKNTTANVFIHIGVATLVLLLITLFQFEYIIDRCATSAYNNAKDIKSGDLAYTVQCYISNIREEIRIIREREPDIDEDDLKQEVYEILRRRIYSAINSEEEYSWVNEIVDYNGGDRYAIRLIHPELSDTEGSYLSTNTKDDRGNFPYREELDGIKKNGYILHEYDFTTSSGKNVHKISYSALMPEFDWVISSGMSVNNVAIYRDLTRRQITPIVVTGTGLIEIIILIGFLLLYRNRQKWERRMYEERQKVLQQKLDVDVLTGANSRRFGEHYLKQRWDDYRKQDDNSLIFMLDVDYFKKVNDTYGHEIGDQVLQSFADAARKVLRSADTIIRWGGDEFIVVVHGSTEEKARTLGERICTSIREIRVQTEAGEAIRLTSSVGITRYHRMDRSYEETLKRADRALYQVKEQGRDGYYILFEDET